MVIDRDVQIVVADPAAMHLPAPDLLAATVQPPAAAVRDSTEFLHIHMEQVPGVRAFVADPGVPPSHGPAGDRVDRGQVWHVVTVKDPPDGRGDQAEFTGQVHRSSVFAGAQVQDLGFGRRVGVGGAGVWA